MPIADNYIARTYLIPRETVDGIDRLAKYNEQTKRGVLITLVREAVALLPIEDANQCVKQT